MAKQPAAPIPLRAAPRRVRDGLYETTLDSRVLARAAYAPVRRELTVAFVTGRRYRYLDVPQHVYAALLAAPSAGVYFNTQIRDVYRVQELR